jgi:large subunit ribosomal protein L9
MPMNVILLERVPKLGQMGDVVKVKPGFARNYLLPQKKALRATKDNITYFESQRKVLEAQNLERRSEAEAVGDKMKDLKVTLIRQASEALQLYGSVTSRDISDAAVAAGVKIERSQVELDKPIKTLGAHKIKVHLHPEVAVEITASALPIRRLPCSRPRRPLKARPPKASPPKPRLRQRKSRPPTNSAPGLGPCERFERMPSLRDGMRFRLSVP